MAVMLSIQNRASASTALPGVLAMQGSNPRYGRVARRPRLVNQIGNVAVYPEELVFEPSSWPAARPAVASGHDLAQDGPAGS